MQGQLRLRGLCAPSIQMPLGLGQPAQGPDRQLCARPAPFLPLLPRHPWLDLPEPRLLSSSSSLQQSQFSFCGCVLMNVCFPRASRGVHFAHPCSLVRYLARSRCSANTTRNVGESYPFILGPSAGRMTILSWLFGVRWLGRGLPGEVGQPLRAQLLSPPPPLHATSLFSVRLWTAPVSSSAAPAHPKPGMGLAPSLLAFSKH